MPDLGGGGGEGGGAGHRGRAAYLGKGTWVLGFGGSEAQCMCTVAKVLADAEMLLTQFDHADINNVKRLTRSNKADCQR